MALPHPHNPVPQQEATDPLLLSEAQPSEIAGKASFTHIRYAQCWEDAEVLLAALAIQPGDHCLAIASAGDNALAMLTANPAKVVALDLSPAQLACLELRVAAYQVLSHGQLLQLIGSRPCENRMALYRQCRPMLSHPVRVFWDCKAPAIRQGIGSAGKFERYFHLFRQWVLPLVHNRQTVQTLLQGGGTEQQRQAFYDRYWNTPRWRALFRVFFSRQVMGALGRDPAFFAYVEEPVSQRIFERTAYALTVLDPAENPYLQWILTGQHSPACLPLALQPQHFDTIRQNLDRLEWRAQSVEHYLQEVEPGSIHRFNLSDLFEYMAPQRYHAVLEQLATAGAVGGRLVYWNMLVQRQRPDTLAERLHPLTELAETLFAQDKAFFYSALRIEEIR